MEYKSFIEPSLTNNITNVEVHSEPCQKSKMLKAVNHFRKTLHLQYLTEF